MNMLGDPEPFACTFGIETDLANFDMLEHVNHVFAAWSGSIRPWQSTNLTLTKVIGRFGQDAADDIIVESDLTPINGAQSGSFLPQNCAWLVKKHTAFGGRRNRGRLYVPYAILESNVSDIGVITPAVQTNLEGAADDLFDGLLSTAGGLEPATPMVILHRSVVPIAPTLVTSLSSEPVIATQRRRLRR